MVYTTKEAAAQKKWRENHKDDAEYKEKHRKWTADHYQRMKTGNPDKYEHYCNMSRLRYWRRMKQRDESCFHNSLERLKGRNEERYRAIYEALVEPHSENEKL